MLLTARLAALFLFAAGTVAAEERFYPVVGADGVVNVIRSDARETHRPAGDSNKASDSAESGVPQPISNSVASSKKLLSTPAAYDSDNYADIEDVEAAVSEPEKKRFYVINDALGSHVQSGKGQLIDVLPLGVASAHDDNAGIAISRPLQSVDAAGAVGLFAGLPGCLSASLKSDGFDLKKPASLVINKQSYLFLDRSRALATYQLSGVGLRTLRLMTFSNYDEKQAFVEPYLAFYDAKGCLVRVVTRYFNRLYPSNPKQHAALASDLAVHADEHYMTVVAPEQERRADDPLPFQHSDSGQLTFHLVK